MKLAIALLIFSPFVFSVNLLADTAEDEASWVVETGTLVLSGQAAEDLYESLNAKVKLDPLSTKWDELRIKKNKFGTCKANYYRVDDPNGEAEWTIESANCHIQAPKGTTLKE